MVPYTIHQISQWRQSEPLAEKLHLSDKWRIRLGGAVLNHFEAELNRKGPLLPHHTTQKGYFMTLYSSSVQTLSLGFIGFLPLVYNCLCHRLRTLVLCVWALCLYFISFYEPYVCISQALCLYFKGSLPTVSELFARYAFVINGLLA